VLRRGTDAVAHGVEDAAGMRAVLACVAAGLVLVPLSAAAPRDVPLTPCTLAGSVSARCGTFPVPESRAAPDGRTIVLRLAVLPARDGGSQRDPLVFLAGGPGGSAVESAGFVASVFGALNASRDIVLVDQRGTGGSNRLLCPLPPREAALDTPAKLRAHVRSCLARLAADPRAYTTVHAMDDVADVLRALGYEQVNLYGGSYGGTAAQYFLAQHPDMVRTAILDGATLLDVPLFELWGRNGERALRRILSRCAGSPRCSRAFPRVRRDVFEALGALRRKPVRLDGRVLDVATAADAIQSLSRSPGGAASIPWIAHRARAGDWLPLELAIETQLALRTAVSRQVMYWSIVCAEPWAKRRPGRSAAASRGTYLAESVERDVRASAAVCSAMPRAAVPNWTRTRIRSDAPVLLLVGGADPQDPPANVARARRQLPNSRTVVVPGAGHGVVQLGCVPQIARAFVERGTVAGLDARCAAEWRPPAFVLPP
jgi:pimeloyl-ACP methyl ester carboxylesterase